MFNFRLINTPDGNQVIDPSLKTPYDSLTATEMIGYIEVANRMTYMERVERQKQKDEKRKYKLARNPLWKLACFCGIV